MNILFITAFVPNPSAAAEKNTMIMLNDLGEEHKVDLIYFKYPEYPEYIPECTNVEVIFSKKISILKKLLNVLNFPFVHPLFSVRFNWFLLFKIKCLIQRNKYDLIIFNHSQTFLYAHLLSNEIPKFLLSHDVIIQRVSRTSSKLVQKLCKLSEGVCLKGENKYVFSFCVKDCNLISENYKIPSYLCLDYIDEKIISSKSTSIDDYFVLFGDWRRADNYEGAAWFFKEVLPLSKNIISIKIIGRNFPLRILESVPQWCNVENLGFVENPYPIISNSKALISPLFSGAGIKVKVVESLACGTPVIGNDIAFEGISNEFKKYMISVNTPQEYLNAMDVPLTDMKEREALKDRFVNSYKSETLPVYIQKLLYKYE